MRAILIGLLLTPALWSQKTEWTVRYLAGPYRAGEGQRVPLEVRSGRVVLNGQNSIPVEAITDVAYQRVSFQRFQPLLSADDLENGNWAEAGIFGVMFVAAAVVTDSFLELPHGSRHLIHLIFFDSGRANRLTLEASKRDYRVLLAALVRVTGRPWKDFYEIPTEGVVWRDAPWKDFGDRAPERYVRKKITLDADAQAAALRGVQASLGRRTPVPAHLAPEN